MRGAAKLFVRLYPAQWRERYGAEFEALIEDSGPGWRALPDLVQGGFRMQLRTLAFSRQAVILSLAGLVAGFGASWLATPLYISQVDLQMHPGSTERVIGLERQVESRTSLAAIIQDPRLDLYKKERASQPLEDVIQKMRTRDIGIRPMRRDGSLFQISFGYPDPEQARATVQALLMRFVEENLHAAEQQGARGTSAGETLGVLDPPTLPTRSATPNRAIFGAIGFGAGFVLAVLVAVFRRTPPPLPFPAQTA